MPRDKDDTPPAPPAPTLTEVVESELSRGHIGWSTTCTPTDAEAVIRPRAEAAGYVLEITPFDATLVTVQMTRRDVAAALVPVPDDAPAPLAISDLPTAELAAELARRTLSGAEGRGRGSTRDDRQS